MIKFSVKGDWSKTDRFLERALSLMKLGKFDKYGQKGVDALRSATPKDTSKTANLWYYEIVRKKESVSIQWLNPSQNDGVSIVILLQYGHGLSNGSYIEGLDFINPAIKSVFEQMANDLWKELTNG